MLDDRINPSYGALQLHKALRTATTHADPETRERAVDKVNKWKDLLAGIAAGVLSIGSRTPVKGKPAWLTLEVLTGGFASGSLKAGGKLLPFEKDICKKLPFLSDRKRFDARDRQILNYWFISEEGFRELIDRLGEGDYEILVPEEGALLVAAWLASNGYESESRELVATLEPWFDQVRFFPRPAKSTQRFTDKVFLRDVKSASESLRGMVTPPQISAQLEAINVWQPFQDKVIEFIVSICKTRPESQIDAAADGEFMPDFDQKATVAEAGRLSSEFRSLSKIHTFCKKPVRKYTLAQMMKILGQIAETGKPTMPQRARLSTLCWRNVRKRGLPGSAKHQEFRDQQRLQTRKPLFAHVGKLVALRMSEKEQSRGLEDVSSVLHPVLDSESSEQISTGVEIPSAVRRKVKPCMMDSVDQLVADGVITSAETLAIVLPQVTGNLHAATIVDPSLKLLFATIYRAFRSRRSLLLLDYQSQVQLQELPWVSVLDKFRDSSSHLPGVLAARELGGLAISSFPHSIFPNKLLQEFRAIAKTAGIGMPIVDELAADIFMGSFTAKFVEAAQVAADLLEGTLYQVYYQIDFKEIQSLAIGHGPNKEFAAICGRRSVKGVGGGSWSAKNGTIIEQQQVLTTQNLAAVVSCFEIAGDLKPKWSLLAQSCFKWICAQLQIKDREYHAKLVKLKNSAYAWRQMVFFLSFVDEKETGQFLQWASEYLSQQTDEFQIRFGPALEGLHAATESQWRGVELPASHQPFYGWALGKHWLLAESRNTI